MLRWEENIHSKHLNAPVTRNHSIAWNGPGIIFPLIYPFYYFNFYVLMCRVKTIELSVMYNRYYCVQLQNTEFCL